LIDIPFFNLFILKIIKSFIFSTNPKLSSVGRAASPSPVASGLPIDAARLFCFFLWQ